MALMRDSEKGPQCPLCFRELTEKDEFLRFCPLNSEHHERLQFNDANLKDLSMCRRCGPQRSIRQRPFLLHVGCEALNPFWDKNSSALMSAAEMDDVKVDHWEVGILKEIFKVSELSGFREMWYPEALFQANIGFHRGRRITTLVALCGAKASGKTVMATMSLFSDQMDQSRYADH